MEVFEVFFSFFIIIKLVIRCRIYFLVGYLFRRFKVGRVFRGV